jgi:alpha-aminoadipic semialdehyde synthase
VNIIGIRREDLSKIGERRTAIAPPQARLVVESGTRLIVQPGVHPQTGELKRAFRDEEYTAVGADIAEDLSAADVIFGLKEVDIEDLLPEKTYLFFSHSHKGQRKNRPLLKAMMEAGISLIDYELLCSERGRRLLTAFGRFAGMAGMVDTLWVYGQRLADEDISNPFDTLRQAVHTPGVPVVKKMLLEVGEQIQLHGTPEDLPPVIICVLGRGRTSAGAQEMLDILPVEEVTIDDLPSILADGDRQRVYKLVLEVDEMYRISDSFPKEKQQFAGMSPSQRFEYYIENPDYFESNLDQVLPYASVIVNCIIWSDAYPRTITGDLMEQIWKGGTPLRVIGDVSCDPNGSIEFSRETWIDDPVFTYDPESRGFSDGFSSAGLNVMAVTNLPCEFSRDASTRFSEQVEALLPEILAARLEGTLAESGLSETLKDGTILWHGRLTPPFEYMKTFVE